MGNPTPSRPTEQFSPTSSMMMDPRTASMLNPKTKGLGRAVSQIQSHHKLLKPLGVNYPKSRVEELWRRYNTNATYSDNVLSAMWQDANALDLFSDQSNDVVKRQIRIERHLQQVHHAIQNCLKLIASNDFTEAALALHYIGSYHSEKGVSAAMFQKFLPGCLNTIEKFNKASGVTMTELETEMVRTAMDIIISTILAGVHRHQAAVQYTAMLADKTGGCVERKRLRRKCVTKIAERSWKKLSDEIMYN